MGAYDEGNGVVRPSNMLAADMSASAALCTLLFMPPFPIQGDATGIEEEALGCQAGGRGRMGTWPANVPVYGAGVVRKRAGGGTVGST